MTSVKNKNVEEHIICFILLGIKWKSFYFIVPFCITVNIAAVIALLLVPAATISILLTLLSWWHKTKPFFKHIHCYQTVRSIMEKKIDAVIRVHTIDIPPQTTWMAELCFRCSFSWNVLGPTMLCFLFCSQIYLFSDSIIYWQQFLQSLIEKFVAVIFCIGFYWSNS